jgi:hypothetical protein
MESKEVELLNNAVKECCCVIAFSKQVINAANEIRSSHGDFQLYLKEEAKFYWHVFDSARFIRTFAHSALET